MFDNVALNVVIGLVFIYLLYSLLASVLSEIIATYLGLRARNLKEAVDRMLNDQDKKKHSFWYRLWDSLKLMKNPKNDRITNFYNYPEIKYLGSTGIFKQPSQFKSVSFSRTLLIMLNEIAYKLKQAGGTATMQSPEEGAIPDIPAEPITKENIQIALKGIISDHRNNKLTDKDKIVLDLETAKYIESLWNECYGDLVKFNLKLERWFDRTMEQCTEWYKRKIQIVLLVLGFALACFFNADSFNIIHKLSKDKDARDKMVTLASAYIQAHSDTPTAANPDPAISKKQLDSLKIVQQQLEDDINNANTILGSGGWPPNIVMVGYDSSRKKKTYFPLIDLVSLSKDQKQIATGKKIVFSTYDKWAYLGRLIYHHFFGFLITAIAISLGAPFWFDMLNKLMQLRTSLKQGTDSTAANTNTTVSPLNREA